jgi:hypothetical protein
MSKITTNAKDDENYNIPSYDEVLKVVKDGISKYYNNPGIHHDVWNDGNR